MITDSLLAAVRGTTCTEIIQMAREVGAKKIYFASAAPPVRYPNLYGIDIPSRHELIAHERTEDEIAGTVLSLSPLSLLSSTLLTCPDVVLPAAIGADLVVYNDLEDLEESIRSLNPSLQSFDSSCFNGLYVTPEVTPALLCDVEESRGRGRLSASLSLLCGDGNGKGCEVPNVINILVREGEEEIDETITATATGTGVNGSSTLSPPSIRSCESIQNLNPDTPSAKRMRTSDL
jgi:hypothetical protein